VAVLFMLAPAACELPHSGCFVAPTRSRAGRDNLITILWRPSHVTSVQLTPLVKIAHLGFMKRERNCYNK